MPMTLAPSMAAFGSILHTKARCQGSPSRPQKPRLGALDISAYFAESNQEATDDEGNEDDESEEDEDDE